MSLKTKDVVLSEDRPKTLLLQKHSDYIAAFGANKDDYEYCMTEYLRMSGIYWSLTAMELMDQGSRYKHLPSSYFFFFYPSMQPNHHCCNSCSAQIFCIPCYIFAFSSLHNENNIPYIVIKLDYLHAKILCIATSG